MLTMTTPPAYGSKPGSQSQTKQSQTKQSHAKQIHQATLVTAANPAELSPIEAAIIDLCNELYEISGGMPVSPIGLAGDAGGTDGDEPVRIRRLLLTLLEKYEASDAEDHPNPAWATLNQRALAMSALGEPETAINLELDALEHADTPRRLEISLGNLADRCIRLERYDEAVVFGLRAQEVAPGSTPILLTTAQAMHLAGFTDEADTIFGAFLAEPDAPTPGTELWAYLESETRLQSMANDLPSLAKLRERWLAKRDAQSQLHDHSPHHDSSPSSHHGPNEGDRS